MPVVPDTLNRGSFDPVTGATRVSLRDASGAAADGATAAQIGEVQATPTANTVLRRLKDLLTGIILAAGENFVGAVGGKTVVVGGNFTRPSDTSAYASGDLVANSVTAGSVAPITVAAGRVTDGTGMIRRVRLKKSGTSTTNASFRVHFYKDDPSASTGITNGDNGAWLTKEANYIGAFDVTLDRAFSDAAKGNAAPITGSELNFVCSSGTANIFALIEARAAYTPVSGEVFTLACEVLQN